jgi:hypothetical protein
MKSERRDIRPLYMLSLHDVNPVLGCDVLFGSSPHLITSLEHAGRALLQNINAQMKDMLLLGALQMRASIHQITGNQLVCDCLVIHSVSVMEGGLPAWKNLGLPLETEEVLEDVIMGPTRAARAVPPPASQYKASFDASKVSRKDQLVISL